MSLMTKTAMSFIAASIICAASPAFANPQTTPQQTVKSEPLKANSTQELAEKMTGKHVDELPEATSSVKAVQDPNEVVCKKIEKTGSRLGAKKVCAPRKEWDAMKTDSKNSLNHWQSMRRQGD